MVDDIPEKTFARQYPCVQPDYLFSILVDALRQSPSFKVWKADEKSRLIDMTTYPLLSGVSNRREQVDVSVLPGGDSDSSVVQIRVTPSTAAYQFTLVDLFLRKKGIVESRADSIAKLIFDDLLSSRAG